MSESQVVDGVSEVDLELSIIELDARDFTHAYLVWSLLVDVCKSEPLDHLGNSHRGSNDLLAVMDVDLVVKQEVWIQLHIHAMFT